MKKWIGWITTLLVVIVYLLWGFVEVVKTQREVWEILAESGIFLILSFFLTNTWGTQGEVDAMMTDEFQSTRKALYEKQIEVKPIIHLADKYCDIKNKQAYKEVRTLMLIGAGLRYEDYFDDNGVFIGEDLKIKKGDTRQQRKEKRRGNRVLRKARKLKLTTISKSDLLSENNKQLDPLNSGRSRAEFRLGENVRKSLTKVLTALFTGLYIFNPVGLNTGVLIQRIVISVISVLLGSLSYITYNRFILTEYRNKLITKIDWNDEMKIMYKQGLLGNKKEGE